MIQSSQINAEHIINFSELLSTLNTNNLALGEYQLDYLKHLLFHKKYFLSIYAQVLNEVLNNTAKQKEDILLVDYGAGNGLLGLFAKHCGFGKIIQVDTSAGCTESQRILAKQLNIAIDDHLNGDYEMLSRYILGAPDALVATDVIEHIYDLNDFFSTLQRVNKNMVIVFTTASNDRNWWKKKILMRIQRKDEWEGYEGQNSNASLLPFREVRKRMIMEQLPNISSAHLNQLITHTRGLRYDDIIKACMAYRDKNIFPGLIEHPTNTCDPASGSWTERFLSFGEYKNLFNSNGYTLFISDGYYNQYQSGFKGKVLCLANILIKSLGKAGSRISPFIILTGTAIANKK